MQIIGAVGTATDLTPAVVDHCARPSLFFTVTSSSNGLNLPIQHPNVSRSNVPAITLRSPALLYVSHAHLSATQSTLAFRACRAKAHAVQCVIKRYGATSMQISRRQLYRILYCLRLFPLVDWARPLDTFSVTALAPSGKSRGKNPSGPSAAHISSE